MDQRNERELIKKYFHYLFDKYGFTIIEVRYFEHFSNWVAVLTSDKCRLRFIEDRGTVMLAVGPPWDWSDWESGPWYDLSFVIDYLTQGKSKLDYDDIGPAEPQLGRLASILHPYMDQICAMFNPHTFPEHEDKLRLLWKKYAASLKPAKNL